MSNYKLIHVDTLEVTMCKKYTIGGFEYYVKSDNELDATQLGISNHFYQILNNTIATTNKDLHLCPQVVDYLQYLAEKASSKDDFVSEKSFKLGYQKHSETHSLSDKEVFRFFVCFLNNPQLTSGTMGKKLDMKKTLEIFKSTLPTKVYYR